MKYKAYLNFGYEGDSEIRLTNLPVAMMAVDGGTARLIDFRKTDDISLISELEQARNFKNIILYLAATRGNADARAVYELTNVNKQDIAIQLLLIIERFSGGKMIEGLGIYTGDGMVEYPPIPALKNTFVTSIKLPETELYRGKITNHHMPTVFEF